MNEQKRNNEITSRFKQARANANEKKVASRLDCDATSSLLSMRSKGNELTSPNSDSQLVAMQSVRSLVLFIMALLLVSCSTVPPLNPPSGFIAGIPVEKSKVVVLQSQEVKMSAINSNVLPAGEYRPVFEDNTGVYYQAPAAMIYRESFLGARQPDVAFLGGIYLERTNPRVAKIYEKQTAEQGPRRSLLTWSVKLPRNGFVPRELIKFQLKR